MICGRKKGFEYMNFMKELFAAVGIDLEIRNMVTDYRLPDGSSAHLAHQIVANGVKCTDADIVERVRAALPADCQICSICEVFGDFTVKELQQLANSFELLNYKTRPVYINKTLAAEYLQEIREGNWK